jgi:hypothetical protein
MVKKTGVSLLTSHSCEFTVFPTLVLSPGLAFTKFEAEIKWGFWGVGFYIYTHVPRSEVKPSRPWPRSADPRAMP